MFQGVKATDMVNGTAPLAIAPASFQRKEIALVAKNMSRTNHKSRVSDYHYNFVHVVTWLASPLHTNVGSPPLLHNREL